MRGMKPAYPHVIGSQCLNRPVRRPTPEEARRALARDLSFGPAGLHTGKAAHIAWVPLMDVALDGIAGMAVAQSRTWGQAA
jgi:hypothetical protein